MANVFTRKLKESKAIQNSKPIANEIIFLLPTPEIKSRYIKKSNAVEILKARKPEGKVNFLI